MTENLDVILGATGSAGTLFAIFLKVALNRTMDRLERIEAVAAAKSERIAELEKDMAILMDAKARDQETYRLVIILAEKAKSLEKDIDAAHSTLRIIKGE